MAIDVTGPDRGFDRKAVRAQDEPVKVPAGIPRGVHVDAALPDSLGAAVIGTGTPIRLTLAFAGRWRAA